MLRMNVSRVAAEGADSGVVARSAIAPEKEGLGQLSQAPGLT